MYGLIFHANLQYAEIPKSEIGNVIEKSYISTIEKLISKDIPFALNTTGFSLSYLPKKLISIIKEGIQSNLIMLTGTSYTHAILPLLPLDRIWSQIERDLNVKKELFDFSPTLFWPPELAYDPILPAILKEFGYTNIFVDGEALLYSKNMNAVFRENKVPYIRLIEASYGKSPYLNYFLGLRKLKKSLSYVFEGKTIVKGVSEILGIPVWQPVNITLMLGLGKFPFMNPKKSAKRLKKLNDIMLYGTDIEFFGYMPFGGKIMNIDSLIYFVKSNDFEIDFPTKIKNSKRGYYLKTSSWAPDKSLRIWYEDEDNRRLNFLSKDLDGELSFVAENSDARGWEPIPERRLDSFRAIYKNWRNKNE